MTAFLAQIGQQLAQRWANVLVLPGLLFLAVAASGHVLGQAHFYDVALLLHSSEKLATQFDGRPVAAVLSVAGIVLGAAAAALLAQGFGTVARSLWLVDRLPGPLGAVVRHMVDKRRHDWQAANDAYQRYKESPAAEAAAARDEKLAVLGDKLKRIALAAPVRPTWIGDRIAAASSRIHGQYNLSLDFAWPRLWLILPELARTEVKDARDSFDRAATLQGWGLLYMVLGIEWWPAAVAGLCTAVLAWRRGRTSMGALADLVESAFDLYASTLVKGLGYEPPVSPATSDWQAFPSTANWGAADDWMRKGL